jgi:hypothetical protein
LNVWWIREIHTGFWWGDLKILPGKPGCRQEDVLILEASAVTKFNEIFSGRQLYQSIRMF